MNLKPLAPRLQWSLIFFLAILAWLAVIGGVTVISALVSMVTR